MFKIYSQDNPEVIYVSKLFKNEIKLKIKIFQQNYWFIYNVWDSWHPTRGLCLQWSFSFQGTYLYVIYFSYEKVPAHFIWSELAFLMLLMVSLFWYKKLWNRLGILEHLGVRLTSVGTTISTFNSHWVVTRK